jgi:hypothetical protein
MTDYRSALADVTDPLVLICEPARSHDCALLIIDEDHTVRVTTRTRYGSGNAIPMSEWHNRDLVYTIASASNGSCAVDVKRLREDLDDGGPLAVLIDRIIAGHSVEWNGNNYAGRLTDDAYDAATELDETFGNKPYVSDIAVWDAANWIWGDNSAAFALEALELTIDATDADIARAAQSLRDDATTNDAILTGDIEEAIREIIARAKEDAVGYPTSPGGVFI